MSTRVCLRCLLPIVALTTLLPLFPFPPAHGRVGAAQDITAPSAVGSLGALPGEPGEPGSVVLSWIAPGDDHNAGTAAEYQVRYYTEPITATSWIDALDVTGEPAPAPAGSPQSMVVSGLPAGQRLYFALKTADEELNLSAVSNSVSAVVPLGANATYLPWVGRGVEGVEPVIPDTTEPLTEATTQYLESLSDDMTFTFSQMTPELADLDAGDVMVGGASANAPGGFLRKVKSVTVDCDQVVVETDPATLEDAIQDGAFTGSTRLTPGQVRVFTEAEGVTMRPSPDGLRFEFGIEDLVVYDDDGNLKTTGDQILVDGTMSLELTLNFGGELHWFELKRLWFSVGVDQEADVAIHYDFPITFEKEFELGEIKFSPITVMVGPVPVVLTPELGFSLNVEGGVTIQLSAGVTQHASLLAGAAYENGQWSPISEFSNEMELNPPAFDVEANFHVGLGGELSIKLYDIAGPYVGLEAFLEVTAAPLDLLTVAVDVGLELTAGAKVEVLGKTLAQYEVFFRWPVRLLEWQWNENSPPNLPSEPLPADDALNEPRNVLLIWTGGDPDGDEVSYDVYLEANAPYPDEPVATDLESPVFEVPAPLEPDTFYYWRVVATDEEGETTAGPVWSLRTGTDIDQPPVEPWAPEPPDGSTTAPFYTLLSWDGGDPDGDEVTYDVYVDGWPGPAQTLVCDDVIDTWCQPGPAEGDVYWRVVARDEHGRTTDGPEWTYYSSGWVGNSPPYEPSAPSPGEAAINQDLWTVLEWSGGDPNEEPVAYDVYLEADDGTPDVLACAGASEPWCDPGPLAGDRQYYWRVVARDPGGLMAASEVWRFATADMVLVPGGEFQMGCDECATREECSAADELPLHAVRVRQYAIDRTEVTNAEYQACVAVGACHAPASSASRTRPSYYGNPEFADYPVLWVFHEWAAAYCAWAGGSAQASMWGLPTEAQWEKAARGTEGRLVYPWGVGEPDCSVMNHRYWDGSGYVECVGDTAAVGRYPAGAGPYGALDMGGNVAEWIADVYVGDYYSWSPYEDPPGPTEGDGYGIRGGSWLDTATWARAANRDFGDVEDARDTLGFRCAAVGEQLCLPGPDEVSLFVEANYYGLCVTRGIGDYGTPGAIGLPNDSITSLKVGANVQATLCEHDWFAGICEEFAADDPALWDNGIGNDQVSSMSVTPK